MRIGNQGFLIPATLHSEFRASGISLFNYNIQKNG